MRGRRVARRALIVGTAAGAIGGIAASNNSASPEPSMLLTSTTRGVVYARRPQDALSLPGTLICILASHQPPYTNEEHCNICSQEFSFFSLWRHHCRNCGETVCDDHSKAKRRLPWFGIGYSERVCDRCRNSIDSGEYEQELIQQHHQRIAQLPSQQHIVEASAYVVPAQEDVKLENEMQQSPDVLPCSEPEGPKFDV